MTGDRLAYTLWLADDALVLAQRMGEWATRAPQIEEDVALLNIGLDLLGQARNLLSYAGELEGLGRDEDAFAFLRDEPDFHNAQIVELANGDFARSMVRLLLFAAYQRELYARLAGSTDSRLAGIAAKAVNEVSYHVDHAASWVVRLGDGTEESHGRATRALAEVWPYAHELFAPDPLTDRLAAAGVGVDPATLAEPWERSVRPVLAEATLDIPAGDWRPGGGRHGLHTEAFGYLLAELQHLARSHPGAVW